MHDKGVSGLVAYLPQWFVEKFPRLTGWDKFQDNVKIPKRFFLKLVEERLAGYEEGSTKDFIDSFITTIKTTTDPESSFYAEAGSTVLLVFI